MQVATKLIELSVDRKGGCERAAAGVQPATGQLSAKLPALHVAAQKGNLEVVDLLLAKGADRKLLDMHNNTAVILAEKKKHVDIIAWPFPGF